MPNAAYAAAIGEATKSTKREIRFWFDADDGHIHVAADSDFIVTVNGDATSTRGHPKLFEWLRMQLIADGKPASQPPEPKVFRRVAKR